MDHSLRSLARAGMPYDILMPEVERRVGPFRLINWKNDGERTADLSLRGFHLSATTSSVYAERKVAIGVGFRTVWISWR